jgi:ketosteroid isomerase-like protein
LGGDVVSIEENKAIVRTAFDALMSGDLGPLDTLLIPDCVLHQCGFLEPIREVGAIKHLSRGPDGPLTDRQVRLDKIVGEGDIVAIHWQITARVMDEDSADGIGRPVSFMSMSFMTVTGGKITEIWNIQDMSTMWAQLNPPSDAP